MENKTSKYFKYAIGEIVLVVIGILIALQINNWNENQKLKKETHKVLLLLQDEFSRNQNELQTKIEQHKFVKASVDELSDLIKPNPEEIEENKLDSLMFSMIYIPEFNASTAISSSEKLDLVDDELKALVNDWKLNYDYYKYSIKLIYDNLSSQSSFITENYQAKNYKNELIASKKSAFDKDQRTILSSAVFENYVHLKALNAGFLVKRSTALYEIQHKILLYLEKKISTYD
ncbi:MAG: DUF6090 family protein [Polaribacter sp.]|nr:DUF6090 family protein [Polaribacter sp.]